MKKIMIIGSEGFIGSNLVEWFGREYTVSGADVKPKGPGNYNYVQVLDSKRDLESIFKNDKYDVCINCSGSSSVQNSFIDPQADHISNVAVVLDILKVIKEHAKECKFINISSAAVYGNPKKLPIKESDLLSPISPYGHNKMISEAIMKEYSDIFGLFTISLRIFSAYGPKQKKLFLWDLYHKMKGSDKIQLFGNGSESRDYIFIDDISFLIEKVIDNALFDGQAVNCASGIETKIKDLAELFAHISGWDGMISFSGEKISGYPDNWQADIKLSNSLGFFPKYSLEKGLEEYIKWLKELN